MNTRIVRSIERKALKDAQKRVDKIFKTASKQIIKEIAKQLPKDTELYSYNGLCRLVDKDGNDIKKGNYFSRFDNGDRKLEYLASLQYGTSDRELQGNFCIDEVIKSSN